MGDEADEVYQDECGRNCVDKLQDEVGTHDIAVFFDRFLKSKDFVSAIIFFARTKSFGGQEE